MDKLVSSPCSGQWGHLALSPAGTGDTPTLPNPGSVAASAPAESQNTNKTGAETGLGQPETPQQVHKVISITLKKRIKKKNQKNPV